MKKRAKLLVTGVPGMGKTTIGNHFRDVRGFVHFDMECIDNLNKIYAMPEIFINNLIN